MFVLYYFKTICKHISDKISLYCSDPFNYSLMKQFVSLVTNKGRQQSNIATKNRIIWLHFKLNKNVLPIMLQLQT